MRAPFQILAIPYRKKREYQFCVFHRADIDQYQFVAGGGEDDEKPSDAAVREIWEETGIGAASVIPLTSMAYIPASVISEKHRKSWAKDTFVIPEYAFGFECDADIILSDEHTGYEWLDYREAMSRLTWDSNRTALYELNCRLHDHD
jgi:dATP pyrophosphohydrolase